MQALTREECIAIRNRFGITLKWGLALLLEQLFEHPLEGGVRHPAEAVLQKIVTTPAGRIAVAQRIDVVSEMQSELAACVGRVPEAAVAPEIFGSIARLLKSARLDVRVAAVRTLEAWGTAESLELLGQHKDSDPWLESYVRKIVG